MTDESRIASARGLIWAAIFAGFLGWGDVSHAQQGAEVEVLGQLGLHSRVEPWGNEGRMVQGTLTDEMGRPVSGELRVEVEGGRIVDVASCPGVETRNGSQIADDLAQPVAGTQLRVGADGQFCFVTATRGPVVIQATAEHFVAVKHDVSTNESRRLSRPVFSQAPANIDLFGKTKPVVEVLVSGDAQAPPGAALALSLRCGDAEAIIEKTPLSGGRLVRFELGAVPLKTPGNCQFVAEVSAPAHLPLKSTRAVLLRDKIALQVEGTKTLDKVTHVLVSAVGSELGVPRDTLSSGLVEARENGAFIALSPISSGKTTLEIETVSQARRLALLYISSDPSLLAGEPTFVDLEARPRGFRWEGVHTFGLIAFAMWLGWAWLRPSPRGDTKPPVVPPREALVHESGKRSGPISGRVFDSHTGEALAGVRLTLEAPSAETTTRVEESKTDDDGRFRFKAQLEEFTLLRIVAQGESHMTLAATLRSAEATIHLTHRRRALVQNLVSWAKSRGSPWYRGTAPTPGSVQSTAEQLERTETALWARYVGQAAYEPAPPTEETVRELSTPDDARAALAPARGEGP